MNVLDVLQGQGVTMKRSAATSGGEWSGPCPKCGGRDRFQAWPQHPKGTGGKFWCRGCGWKGDVLSLLMDLRGLSFPEACREANVKKARTGFIPKRRVRKDPPWTPNERRDVPAKWSERATEYVEECHKRLLSTEEGQAFAKSRGLTEQTIKAHKIGWADRDRFEIRRAWDLEPETRNGKPRRMWLPWGLVLPGWRNGRVVRIKTRRPSCEDGRPKYVAVSGGETAPLDLDAKPGRPVVVVEAEIDGLLCSQEAGDVICTLALGAAQIRPDREVWELIEAAPIVLCALDFDQAGAHEWLTWWSPNVPNAVRWPVPEGKDPGEFMKAGGDLREWISAGLSSPEDKSEAEG